MRKVYRSIFWLILLFLLLGLGACRKTAQEGVIVTFLVADREEYKIQLTDPADIAIAQQLLASEEAPRIPNGRIIYDDPGVNEGYSWHIDPEMLEFADFTTEVCDGLTSDYYCLWAAEVIAIDE